MPLRLALALGELGPLPPSPRPDRYILSDVTTPSGAQAVLGQFAPADPVDRRPVGFRGGPDHCTT